MPTFVVTGASQGIGRAVAIAFAREQDSRLVLVSRNEDLLEEVAEDCAAVGGDAVVFPCDLTDDDLVEDCARTVIHEWGAPDVVVNNAGLFRPGDLVDTTPRLFRDQIDANLTSAYLVTHAFLPGMLERGSGHLFYMASVASIRGYPGGAAYCAAKHGLLGLSRVVREETKDRGIRVTAIIPGATFTASWEGTDLPEDRFMPPEDVAEMVLQAYHLTGRSVVEEVLLRPQLGDI